MKNPLLKINHLKKTYHDKNGEIEAVLDFTLDIYDKEFLVIVGPSGCGKSTIMSILANLESSSDGYIELNKENLVMGYMLQKDSLFPWLTILDNCLIGLKSSNNLTKKTKKRVIELLDTYGLKEFKDKYPSSLSGGMRQRVALIRTLAINPDILLLDEPFSALDYQTRLALSDDVYNIIKKEGKTAIMISHDIGESVSMADRIVVLTKRPCVIKNIYDIYFEDKSTPIENRKKKEFATYYDKIWRDLDVHIQ